MSFFCDGIQFRFDPEERNLHKRASMLTPGLFIIVAIALLGSLWWAVRDEGGNAN